MPKLKSLALATAVILLSACTLNPIQNGQQPSFNADVPEVWHAKGRFAYQSDNNRESGQFDWRQQGTDYEVRLFGPFGVGSLKISGDPEGVSIEASDQNYRSTEPNQLFFELTGMNIPIDEFRHWLVGAARPANDDWILTYDDFIAVQSYLLPQRVDIETPGESEDKTTSIRLAISSWSLSVED